LEKKENISPDTPVQYLKGIGPKRATVLKSVGINTAGELLAYFPRRYLDRSSITSINRIEPGKEITVVGRVIVCQTIKGRRPRFVVQIEDGTGLLQCVWFQGISYIAKAFNQGDTVAFSGKATFYRSLQLVHPDFDKIFEEGEPDGINTGRIIPLYPSTEKLSRLGLDSRGFRKVIKTAISLVCSGIQEIFPDSILSSFRLMVLSEAFQQVHFPDNWDKLYRARYRFKFEELFFLQLFLALERNKRIKEHNGISFQKAGSLTREFISELDFELTNAQKRVLREIHNDMKSRKVMNRLIQGDVGSGKTVVSLIAMLIAVENGYQAALMAPTEILAEQHFLVIHSQLEKLGVKTMLLRGGHTVSRRKEMYESIRSGDINIVVGTHALVQDDVGFKNLGLVVIDEQHRFGVMQRAKLMEKGMNPDVLLMTATPIPRTLALTFYGDLDVSVIDELPSGRQPVTTVWRKAKERSKIYTYIKDAVRRGEQVYIVYPLLEESEKIDLAAATQEYEKLSNSVFTDFNVGLIHGRMKSDEKESVMNAFKSGEISILVSTTVIEVGVDVPNATVMLIEHAERFGLTQLHQLRGRVGRGPKKSYCILITSGKITEEGVKRVEALTQTNDGFKIAEADLKLRGPGELYGTKQHGDLGLRIADLVTDGEILNKARKAAFKLVMENPDLNGDEFSLLKDKYFEIYKSRFGLIQVG